MNKNRMHFVKDCMWNQIRNLLNYMSRNMQFQHHNNFVYYRLFQRAPLQTDNTKNMNMQFQPHNNWMYNMLFLLDYPQMGMSRNMNMMMMLHILG